MTVALCLLWILLPVPVAFSQAGSSAAVPAYSDDVPREIEFSSLSSLDEAKKLAHKLEDSGYRASITIGSDDDGNPRYLVLVTLGKGESVDAKKLAATPERTSSDEKKPDWSLLGRKGSNLHGSLTFTGIYTDNAYNTRDRKKSNFSTILSPELWLNVPSISQKTTPSGMNPRAAGGLTYGRPWGEVARTYQAFLYYRSDIPLSSSNSFSPYGSTPAHTLGGGFLLTGKRLAFRINDQFEYGYHEREAEMITRPSEQDRYTANLFNAGVSYDTLNRLRMNLEYSRFLTDYSSSLSGFRNRIDQNITATVYYRISPRVNLLAEYQYYDISYDQDSLLDSSEYYLYGGLQWDITAKTKGIVKLGYGDKKFRRGSDSASSFSYEGQIDYRLTAKSSLSLSAYQRSQETNLAGTAFSRASGARLRLQHMLTAKVTTGLLLAYSQDRYSGTIQSPTRGGSAVKATIYQAGLDIQYQPRRWFKARAGYLHTTKASDLSSLQYDTNLLYFMLTGAI